MNAKPANRYLVEWTSWADAKAAAIKRGMPADGSVSDYINFENFDRADECASFKAAVAHARKVLPKDVWHCPRIRRQVLVQNDHDDLGNRVRPTPSYETEATWEVFEDLPDPVEETPDWRDDLAA